MLDVSWGEFAVILGLGLALIGRKDLPHASRVAGTQVGRIVGLLQGARARADRFAAQNELRQLQNELRSGLRELDAVKSELVVSMSGRGLVGRGLGSMVSGVDKPMVSPLPQSSSSSSEIGVATLTRPPLSALHHGVDPVAPEASTDLSAFNDKSPEWSSTMDLPSEKQTIAAVAEEEWERQGIAFKSKAERGAGIVNYDPSTSGSAMLAHVLTQSLIFDQYDRVVREQDRSLQSKAEKIRKEMTKEKPL